MGDVTGSVFRRGLSRISLRKKKQKNIQSSSLVVSQQSSLETTNALQEKTHFFAKGMDRLRKSLRIPKRRDRSNDRSLNPQNGSKQEQWQPDESAVRSGSCCFNVKYLGSVEVYEARGMQICEGALRSLKASKRKPVKAVLYVSGDGLRVVDQGNSRGLLVDQTIEKVSFCAPDRQNDRGFAYICRDGTSRRWMCHGFLATKETGERLSHAVGCAFSICLEKKKQRDDDSSAVPSTSNSAREDVMNPVWDDAERDTSLTRNQRSNLAYQSFKKHVPLQERYLDPQSVIINEVPAASRNIELEKISKPRPSSNPALFKRQGSLRAPDQPSTDNFKRNFSLRAEPTPSNTIVARTLFNEPIHEVDEEHVSSNQKSTNCHNNPIVNNGLEGIDINFSGKPAPFSSNIPPMLNSSNNEFAKWPTIKEEKLVSPLDDIQKQFENIKVAKSIMPSASPALSTSTSRTKADEWLDDVLRVSMTMSPTVSEDNSTLLSSPTLFETKSAPKSGPPPSHAPPPLPTKQAVSNGSLSIYQPEVVSRDSPSIIDWQSSITPSHAVQIPTRPLDPFDIQWSRLTLN